MTTLARFAFYWTTTFTITSLGAFDRLLAVDPACALGTFNALIVGTCLGLLFDPTTNR